MKTKKAISIKQLLKWLHAEARKADADFEALRKEYGRCLSGCMYATEFRSRLATLRDVIIAAGGRP